MFEKKKHKRANILKLNFSSKSRAQLVYISKYLKLRAIYICIIYVYNILHSEIKILTEIIIFF